MIQLKISNQHDGTIVDEKYFNKYDNAVTAALDYIENLPNRYDPFEREFEESYLRGNNSTSVTLWGCHGMFSALNIELIKIQTED